jgi:hypothetical protein
MLVLSMGASVSTRRKRALYVADFRRCTLIQTRLQP